MKGSLLLGSHAILSSSLELYIIDEFLQIFCRPFPPPVLKVARQLYKEKEEREGLEKLSRVRRRRVNFRGCADHGPLSHSCSSFTLEITAALVQGEEGRKGGQNESCSPERRKRGGGREEETRTEIFFSPKKSSRLLLGEEHRFHCSFPNCRDACVRACMRAKRALLGRPLNRFPPPFEERRRDEWEITKERETQSIGIDEISGDGH